VEIKLLVTNTVLVKVLYDLPEPIGDSALFSSKLGEVDNGL
jgi:hypothetical protein